MVGGNQGDRVGAARSMEAADFESHGELYGVVGAKRVFYPESCGIIQQGGRDLGNGIPSDEVLAKTMEER